MTTEEEFVRLRGESDLFFHWSLQDRSGCQLYVFLKSDTALFSGLLFDTDNRSTSCSRSGSNWNFWDAYLNDPSCPAVLVSRKEAVKYVPMLPRFLYDLNVKRG